MIITLYAPDGKETRYPGVTMYSYDHGLLIFTFLSGKETKDIRTTLPFLIEVSDQAEH